MRKHTIQQETLDDSLVFRNVTFEFYDMFVDAMGERPARVSYDGQTLEMRMTLSFEHEGLKSFLGTMVREISRATGMPIVQGGSTTLKYRKRRKGLEPDQCYWVQNAVKVRGLKQLDLSQHPAPDLVIEVDVTHASVNREDIYAAMKVPEMWHYAKSSGLTGWLNNAGDWERLDRSVAFPGVRLADLNKFVTRFVRGEEENQILDDLVKFLSEKENKKKSK